MKKIVIYGEKFTMSKWCASYISDAFAGSEIFIIHSRYLGPVRSKIPRGLKLREYPVVLDQSWEPTSTLDSAEINWVSKIVEEKLIPIPGPIDFATLLNESDELVYAADPGHSSCRSFTAFLHYFGTPSERSKQHRAFVLLSFDHESLTETFATPVIFEDHFKEVISYGMCKAYFDINYTANAVAVFGHLLRSLKIETDDFLLSKYTLQMLYWFHDQDRPHHEGYIHGIMRDWKGTGKYKSGDSQMGSMASRLPIVQNLVKMGVLSEQSGRLMINQLGRHLVAALHPNCRDADLVFRIEAWGRVGIDVSKPKIDRYIRTFFGRQLKLMKSRHPFNQEFSMQNQTPKPG